jgi:hypothetical protein
MALTRAQYLSGNTANGVVLSGQPQGVRPGGAGISIASDGTISVDPSTVTGVVKLNNVSAYNSYIWPTSVPGTLSALTTNATGNLVWTQVPNGIGSVTSVNVSGGTTGLVFSGGPVTTTGTMTMGGILGIANGGTGSNTREGALNDLLPPQFGNAGYVLTTDGSNTSWTNPSQGAVTRIVAGSNVTISPTTGVGVVTINSTGGGGGGGGLTGLQEIDDISGSFNGAITTFSITVSGGQPIPDGPGTGQLVIAVGGVLQTPGDAFTFNNATDTLTFTAPPPAGVSFTGYVGGNADPITDILTTSPISGGGSSGQVTIGMAASGVSAGIYTSPNLTIDAYGRITSASNGVGIPSQTNQETKFLTTNGTSPSWGALRTPDVTATGGLTVANDYVVVTAAGQTITLPASPYSGAVVTVVVAGTFLDTVVAGNGQNIMGLAEDLTLDIANAALQFTYTGNATQGWRIN